MSWGFITVFLPSLPIVWGLLGEFHCHSLTRTPPWVQHSCSRRFTALFKWTPYHSPESSTASLKNLFKKFIFGLPWWGSGWESACQCRGHGFEPCSGKIPHAAEQLSPWATTTEPARLEPVLRNKRGRDSERPAHRDEEWPPLAATGESPRTETKTQHSHK